MIHRINTSLVRLSSVPDFVLPLRIPAKPAEFYARCKSAYRTEISLKDTPPARLEQGKRLKWHSDRNFRYANTFCITASQSLSA